MGESNDLVEIQNCRVLSVDRIDVQRVPLGAPGDYKPCVARLPGGELLLVAFRNTGVEGGKVREDILLFRSTDGARTWSPPETMESLLGREPYLTALTDGTVLMTVHLLAQEIRNDAGRTRALVHRTEDGGHSWTTTTTEPQDAPAGGTGCCTSRNVLEMQDGSLLLGTSAGARECDEIWRSDDRGRTWTRKYRSSVPGIKDDYPYALWGEAHLWQARSGKVFAVIRIDPRYIDAIDGTDIPKSGSNDQFDRMILISSVDEGRTWELAGDFGDYGEMYPSILRLPDDRLILTFTVREVKRPLGVRAVLGLERDDGLDVGFVHDRIMLDTKTAVTDESASSGGGFGPTVRLEDGTLVTSYSWRDEQKETHLETVRWSLPPPLA
jgi:hypothetical protein